MSAVYLETSALLHWLLGQSRAAAVASRLNAADTVVTSVLTGTEGRRALVRGQHSGLLTAAQAARLRGTLARLERTWIVMEVTAEVRARAEEAFPAEPVRTLDALHLATALVFVQAFDDLIVLSTDERIVRNAQALGFAVAH